MISSLRRKFILISALSVSAVFAVIFALVCITSLLQLNRTLDMLTDIISQSGGVFPEFEENSPPVLPQGASRDFITPETRFSTRYFTVYLDKSGEVTRQYSEQISSVSESEINAYAKKAQSKESERGWVSDFRYLISENEDEEYIVFVNGEMNKGITAHLISSLLLVLCISFAVILLLIILFSKRAVKPAAESYEKQRRFVTDANHELKTPLTLILSNVDIIEAENGGSEWLDDIRSEGERMGLLINQLVTLSRMDEENTLPEFADFDLSAAITDTVYEFEGLADTKGKRLLSFIASNVTLSGDEGLIRQLLSILLDNAVKYCDSGGGIVITLLKKGRHSIITVENSHKAVSEIELSRLFDRFYRADKARSFNGSFGIGLSIAKGIVRLHKGDISAYNKDKTHIGFKVTFKA